MKVCAVLLAAGSSQRYGSDKLRLDVGGEPLWLLSYRTLSTSPHVQAVGIVCKAEDVEDFQKQCPDAAFVVPGGSDRQSSSRRGIESVDASFDAAIVHDAARPFVDHGVIERVVHGIMSHGAAFPAIAVTDTLKTKVDGRWHTPDRSAFVSVQTPQGARLSTLLRAHQEASGQYTDEASMIEAIGEPIEAVPGDPRNVKVTHAGDLGRMLGPLETRTGFGYDIHAFSADPERPLWLGGVEFDDRPGLEGHSDADVLLHAIVDALLGAASLGDIGVLFPNTDMTWKDAPSSLFLVRAAELLKERSWVIQNIDATVLAERPKIMVSRQQICERVAELVGIDVDQVSVKATTNERLGSIGRSEGIAAMAVATVVRRTQSH